HIRHGEGIRSAHRVGWAPAYIRDEHPCRARTTGGFDRDIRGETAIDEVTSIEAHGVEDEWNRHTRPDRSRQIPAAENDFGTGPDIRRNGAKGNLERIEIAPRLQISTQQQTVQRGIDQGFAGARFTGPHSASARLPHDERAALTE